MSEEEEWITVAEFPKYEVSTFGKVRREYIKIELKQRFTDGYPYVELYNDERPVRKFKMLVHRLVAISFLDLIPNDDPVNKNFIDHNDNERANCHWYNLQWTTKHQNCMKD